LKNLSGGGYFRLVSTGIYIYLFQGQIGAEFYKADHYDYTVDTKGRCWGYPCPLAIEINSKKFNDSRFNGYYVAYFPFKGNILLQKCQFIVPNCQNVN
jgi:hypothetical protein